MNCLICNSETKDKTKNIPCCRNCRPKVSEKRDKMTEEYNKMEIEAGLNPKLMGELAKMHKGTLKRAILELAKGEK